MLTMASMSSEASLHDCVHMYITDCVLMCFVDILRDHDYFAADACICVDYISVVCQTYPMPILNNFGFCYTSTLHVHIHCNYRMSEYDLM